MAPRRQRSNSSGSLRLIAVPWWVWMILALIAFFLLHSVATINLSGKPPGSAIGLSVLRSFATVVQYLAPIPLVLLAVISAARAQSAQPSWTRYEYGEAPEPTFSPVDEQPKPTPEKALTLALLQQIDWKLFEEVCAEYFRLLGFHSVTQSHGPDGGIDISLRMPEAPETVVGLVQCKQWTSQVGPKAVRELLGVMVDAKVKEGIFITSSVFNTEAQVFAASNGIDLIDGERLIHLIKKQSPEAQLGLLRVALRGDHMTPSCTACGIKMVRRQGGSTGKGFWGCPNFPRCRLRIDR